MPKATAQADIRCATSFVSDVKLCSVCHAQRGTRPGQRYQAEGYQGIAEAMMATQSKSILQTPNGPPLPGPPLLFGPIYTRSISKTGEGYHAVGAHRGSIAISKFWPAFGDTK